MSLLSPTDLISWPGCCTLNNIDQYRQRVGLFNAKATKVHTSKANLDSTSLLLGFILFLISILHNLAPGYMSLFQFFYQQLLPNADSITIKIINASAKRHNKKTFLEPHLEARCWVVLTCSFFYVLSSLQPAVTHSS